MKSLFFICIACMLTATLTQCKKKGKLENPFGLMLLGSDTSLPDGRYVIRTQNGCSGWASTLKCDYIDEVIGMNGSLTAVDHISLLDMDTTEVWYVKKVRYDSPDPDYSLAFGYRIYQMMPDGRYRFLSFTATGSTVTWTDDEIGATFADGNSKSVKAGKHYTDNYPHDPPIPSLATSDDPNPQLSTFSIFQFYKSENNPGSFKLRAGGIRESTGSQPSARWNFCLGYFNDDDCDVSNIHPHFRDDSPTCHGWEENGDRSYRCYIKDIFLQKVY